LNEFEAYLQPKLTKSAFWERPKFDLCGKMDWACGQRLCGGRAPLKSSKPATNQRPYGRGTGIPDPIDVHVGGRIRARRLFLGMTQGTLATALGRSFQQVQKYEHGANRVSASNLSEIAAKLNVPVSFFFADLPAGVKQSNARERMHRAETIKLVQYYYAIPDLKVRRLFLEMVKGVAAMWKAKQE
jgi:transcriptional regulator with XRE-family HTH domain